MACMTAFLGVSPASSLLINPLSVKSTLVNGLKGRSRARIVCSSDRKDPNLLAAQSSASGKGAGNGMEEFFTQKLPQALWGRGLPPGLLVQVAKEVWGGGWQVMMAQLAPRSSTGAYERPQSAFRNRIEVGGNHPPEGGGRYHLYAALSCPWAHRALIVHTLKGLGDDVPLSIAVPGPSGLWEFQSATATTTAAKAVAAAAGSAIKPPAEPRRGGGRGGLQGRSHERVSGSAMGDMGKGVGESAAHAEVEGGGGRGIGAQEEERRLVPTVDRSHGCARVKDVYGLRSGGYDGRCTVPMLWDSKTREVVNNESADIIEILNSAFDGIAGHGAAVNLAPVGLEEEIQSWNLQVYPNVNNGVYRCGFATSQGAYLDSLRSLFATLDDLDAHLADHRYLCGETFTLADVRLFTTLVRFDAVYHTLFKCNEQKIAEYEHLGGYLRDVYQLPGVSSTCDMNAILDSYFGSLFPLNPGGIVPPLPRVSTHAQLMKPHARGGVRAASTAFA
eukprot:TRINITY_DN265_c0_g3_i1.p1 TRINITY_DN265_c0_g3~~TRINITY_DN265_c0_g3_i1.p1  ORF type:complete len:503 (+),score=77.75 TRINITY_DN265_c0_g3_i1:264-1772(+)